MKRQKDGKIRLEPCNDLCPCLCHDTGGGIQELHYHGFCVGKWQTNTLETLTQYIIERSKDN